MKYRYLGRSGLLVSRLCLGTMTFGNTQWGCDQEGSSAIVRKFVEGGGNFIDTADGYSNGESETIPGDVGRTSNCLFWLHTHAALGVIHVEAPVARTFTLAQFFAVWQQGKPLSELTHLDAGVKTMLDDLSWWATALKTAREKA